MHQFEACNREEIRCWSGNILVEPPGASLLGVGVDSRSCLSAVAIVSGDSLIQSGVRNANARCQAAQNIICCPRCGRGNLFFVLLRAPTPWRKEKSPMRHIGTHRRGGAPVRRESPSFRRGRMSISTSSRGNRARGLQGTRAASANATGGAACAVPWLRSGGSVRE